MQPSDQAVCRASIRPWWPIGFLLIGIILTFPAAAFAANGASAGPSEALFIAEIGLLLLVGRLMGEAARQDPRQCGV